MGKELSVYRESEIVRQNLALSGRVDRASADDRVNVHSLMTTLRRRRMLMLSVAVAIFLAAVILTLLATPVYTATAQVVIDTTREQVTPVQEQVLKDSGELTSPAVDTEVQVILSSDLANKVVEALRLDRASAFDPAMVRPSKYARLRAWLFGTPLPVSRRLYDSVAQRQYVINVLSGSLKVLRTGTTFVLSISYTSADPNFSALVANEYARQYARQALDRKREANDAALTFLLKRIEGLRKQAQIDTEAVQQFRIAHNLLSVNAAQLTEQEVSTYNQQLSVARSAAAEDLARMRTAQQQLRGGSNGDDVGEALGSPVVSSLKTQRAQLGAELALLKTRFGPRHPDVQKAENQIADLDRSIQAEVGRVISNLQAKVNVSNQRLASVNSSLGGARGTLASSNRAFTGFDDLMRKAGTSQAMYETYLNRYKEAAAQEGTEKADARVITWAQVPAGASRPKVALNLVLGLFLGLGAGLAAAFLAELMFNGLTTGDDVETRLGVNYLGAIPLIGSIIKKPPPPIEGVLDTHLAFAQAFRSLRTAIAHASEVHVQVVVVTSALPKEGKSTVAACLARMSAIENEKVLLIDCDAHRRSVNALVANPRSAGLLEVLRGEAAIEDALIEDEASGAWLLPLNQTRMNPGDSIASEAMERLINLVRADFTYIVLDTAPVLPVADARILATLADAVVLVSLWRKTSDHAVRSALKLFPPGRVNLAGVLLSCVDMRKQVRFGKGDATFYYDQYKEYFR